MSDPNLICGMNYIPHTTLRAPSTRIEKAKFPVFEAHAHLGKLVIGDNYDTLYDLDNTVDTLKSFGIKRMINLDGFWGDELDRMLAKTQKYNDDFIVTFGTVDVSRLDDPDFESYVYRTLKESKAKGIKGVKVWKNISLYLKDKNGKKIPFDDPRIDCIFKAAGELRLIVLAHVADPIAFFDPIDMYNERYDELHIRPDWSFYGEEFFEFNQLMIMQENVLKNNPDTTFIVAHGGSCSEDLGYVGRCLDKYPNMFIDFAERVSEVGRQPYSSRKFFNKYQDRIVFGTDMNPFNIDYEANFRCLETFDEYFDYSNKPKAPHGNWKIYGIGLEDGALEKIYYKNIEKLLNKEVLT
ncbi:MAG TPA: amidohydrolase [Clostridiales bacterium]|nr:amidohydrolase [Clostridiales bacterium]